MRISERIYAPDQISYETNQRGELTPKQIKNLEKFTVTKINSKIDKFIYFPEEQYYAFEKSSIGGFYDRFRTSSQNNGELLPSVTYRIYYAITSDEAEHFLSAEAINFPDEAQIFSALLQPLMEELEFDEEDARYNRTGKLSPFQKESRTENFGVNQYDFVYVGFDTFDYLPKMRFYKKLKKSMELYDGPFLHNIKYRIYFEEHSETFLSIEPIDFLPVDFTETYLAQKESEKDKDVQNSKPSILFRMFGVFVVILLIGSSLGMITAGIMLLISEDGNFFLFLITSGFGGWLLYLIVKSFITFIKERKKQVY